MQKCLIKFFCPIFVHVVSSYPVISYHKVFCSYSIKSLLLLFMCSYPVMSALSLSLLLNCLHLYIVHNFPYLSHNLLVVLLLVSSASYLVRTSLLNLTFGPDLFVSFRYKCETFCIQGRLSGTV